VSVASQTALTCSSVTPDEPLLEKSEEQVGNISVVDKSTDRVV
jgi:hypothetical protein